MPVRDLKKIAYNYLYGWFFIDFVSIFPFDMLMSSGVATKLFRLARLPRLIKLLDISRFSKLLKSFQNKNSDDQTIVQQYFILYIYNIVRLIIIAIMITYFIGCFLYFMSHELNPKEDRENPEGSLVNQFFRYYDTV